MKNIISTIISITIVIITLYLSTKDHGKGRNQNVLHINKKIFNVLFFIILLIGLFVRTYQFGSIPNGLFRDEISTGYDAYAILNYGIDQNGYKNPIMLVSFGTGDDAIYSYLSMPFIALMGLNAISIRLVNLLMTVLSLFVFCYITKKFYGSLFSLLALFVLATNPWHIMISRWGLNVNIFPAFFLLGIFMLSLIPKNEKFLIPAAIIFGIALYTYETSYFVIPLFFLQLSIYLLNKKLISYKVLSISLLIIIALGIPLATYVVINLFELEPIRTAWFSIPRTVGAARMTVVTSLFSGENFFNALTRHVKDFINVFIFQNDNLVQNVIPGFGTIYLFATPIAILGLGLTIFEQIKKKNLFIDTLFLFWFAASILIVIVMDISINRINIIYLPLIYFIVKALDFIYKQSKPLLTILTVVFLLWFAIFSSAYFRSYPAQIGSSFSESLDQAINYASENSSGDIYISKNIHIAYIYVLFHQKINPNDFISSVIYENPNKAIRYTASFDRYKMVEISQMPMNAEAYILDNRELVKFHPDGYQLTQYKYYCVLIRE